MTTEIARHGAGPEAGLPGTPPSHWLSQVDAGSVPVISSLPSAVDVVVVGGGIMGVATSYWLAVSGIPTLLLEARRLGWGASGRNAGLMLAGQSPVEDTSLLDLILDREGIEAGYETPGHLALASSPEVLGAMHEEVRRRPAWAPPLRVLDRADCEELLGLHLGAGLHGGRWLSTGALVHPGRLLYGLAARAVTHGALVAVGTRVDGTVRTGGDRLTVRTSRGNVTARAAVIACGAATGRLLPGLASVLQPTRGQVLATAPLPPVFRPGMAIDWGSAYWRQAPDGAIVLGGLRGCDPEAEETPREATNWRIQSALGRFLAGVFPDLPRTQVARRWAGIMDVTPDGLPLVGPWPGQSGTWVVAGFGGHGLPPALGVARAVARSIATGRLDGDLQRFEPGRFRGESPC